MPDAMSATEAREMMAHCLAVTLVTLSDGSDPTTQQAWDDFAAEVAIVTDNLLRDPDFLSEDIEDATA